MHARRFERAAWRPWWLALLLAVSVALLAACSDSPAPAPVISVQPSDTSAVAGNAATLSITASGPDLGYQWQVSTDGGTTWTNVAGATQSIYTTPATTLADNGKRYRVVVSAAGISVNSSAVQLTVTAAVVAPTLTVQPAAQTATAPDPASFSVTAGGTAPSYQWQRSTDGGATFVAIAGATAATYSTGATTTTMNGERYRVVVTNGAGSVTSSAVVLTVNPTPVAAAFTTQPANQSVTAGSAAAFTVVATGTPAPTLQWQRSTDGGSTFTNIAGATDPTFNTGLTTVAQNGERYRAVATNSAGGATSDAATLTVNPAPQAPIITTQPTAQTVTAPATATFTAAATGVPTPTWQWQVSSDGGSTFANITGATSASYTTPATTTADSGKRYRASATNSAGSATTGAATLTVDTTTARAWQTATQLQVSAANIEGYNPALAVDGAGKVNAVWLERFIGGGAIDMVSASLTPASGWTTPVGFYNTASTVDATRVAVDGNGNVIVLYRQRAGGLVPDVLVLRYSATAGMWFGPTTLDTGAEAALQNPMALAMDAAGNAIALWQYVKSTGGSEMRYARYTPSGGWTPKAAIDLGPGADSANSPTLGFDSAGNAIAVWAQTGSAGNNIASARYVPATGWAATQVIEASGANTSEPWVAVNAAGEATAVWLQDGGGTVWANRYTPGTGWGSATLVQTSAFAGSTAIVRPRVALDASGNAMAIWRQYDGTRFRTYAGRDAAGVWGAAGPVSVAGEDAYDASLACNASGRCLAIWTSNAPSSGTYTTTAAAFAPLSGWAAPVAVEPAGNSTAGRPPTVVLDARGEGTAVWRNKDGKIWFNRYR
ncbi:MAG TPA: hypothetical protein VFQ20_08215 [Burkholderiaceae bacterium]|nr:hypothetical protein [Burkholderiaceae bacterium]